MKSGKTSHLRKVIEQLAISQTSCQFVYPERSTKRSMGGDDVCHALLSSHNSRVVYDQSHIDIINKYITEVRVENCTTFTFGSPPDGSVVAIDEGHFFPLLPDALKRWHNENRKILVVIAALTSSYKQESFRCVTECVQFCSKIEVFHGICDVCKCEKSQFSKLIDSSILGDEIIVGSSLYTPVCAGCYNS